MCGIVGIVDTEEVSAERIVRYCRTLRHRGPDDLGFVTLQNVAVGMTRLAIIDPEGGKQPMHSHDRSVSVVFNGEIYNFQGLRAQLEEKHRFSTKSDTEVILNGYLEWGTGVFSKLNGMFAIALLDNRTRELILARDPVGVKPLYYHLTPSHFIFSSELKTFSEMDVTRRVSHDALRHFLASGYVHSPTTALAGVQPLEPGMCLRITADLQVRKFQYREPLKPHVPLSKTDAEWAESIEEHLCEAIQRQTISDVPYGLLLSSGLDSMFILSAIRDTAGPINTFTLYYEEQSYSENTLVAKVTQDWKIPNEQILLTAKTVLEDFEHMCFSLDNLEFLPTSIAMYHLCKIAGSSLKMVLSGNGGDELFFGYPTHKATQLLLRAGKLSPYLRYIQPLLSLLPVKATYMSLREKMERFLYGAAFPVPLAHLSWRSVFPNKELRQLLRPPFNEFSSEEIFSNQISYFNQAQKLGFEDEDMFMYLDFHTWLVDCNLSLWDKAGMANSLEIRVPFLDLDFIDLCMQAPRALRTKDLGNKGLFRQVSRRRLPDSICDFPKHGFQAPVATWMQEPHAAALREYTRLLPAEVFYQSFIDAMWRRQAESKGDLSLRLWVLCCLGAWASQHKIQWN